MRCSRPVAALLILGASLGLVAGAVALVATVFVPAAAFAQGDDDTDPGSEADIQTALREAGGMELLAIDPGVVGAGAVRIRLRLPGVVAAPDELIVNIHGPVSSEAHFLSTTQGQSLGGVLQTQTFPLSGLEISATGVAELVLQINQPPSEPGEPGEPGEEAEQASPPASQPSPPIRLVAEGVYPITIELRTQAQQLVARQVTHISHVVASTAAGTAAGTRSEAALSVLLVADLTSDSATDISEWLDVFSRHVEIPALVAVIPELFDKPENADSAQRLAQAVGEARGQADAVQARARQRLVLAPYYPIDLVTLAEAELTSEIEQLFALGEQTLGRHGEVASSRLWIGNRTASAEELAANVNLGVRSAILPASALRASPSGTTSGTTSSGGSNPGNTGTGTITPNAFITVANTPVQVLVIGQLAPPQPVDTPGSAAQRVLAHLSTIALNNAQPNQFDSVVVVDLSADQYSPQLADAVLTAIEQLPIVEAVSAEVALNNAAAGSPPRQFSLPPRSDVVASTSAAGSSIDNASTGIADEYLAARQQLSSYRSMIRNENTADHDEQSRNLLATLSTAATASEKEAQWQQVNNFVKLQISQLEARTSRSLRLTSRSAQVPFSFLNTGSIPLRVELRLLSDKLTVDDFDDGESTTLVLPPGVTTHEFGLQTLGSGAFLMNLELHSPDGELLLGRTPIEMQSVTPTWAGLLLVAGATAFLLIWWVMDSRRRRRQSANA